MKKIKRPTSLLLALILLISLPISRVSAQAAASEESTATRVQEMESLRETNSETYLLSDGSYECVVYSEDKYYYDESNTLLAIDNSIIQNETASLSDSRQYKNAANGFDVYFSDNGIPEISLHYNGKGITFSPLSATGTATNHISANDCAALIGKVNTCSTLDDLTQTGSNTVTYDNAFPNADLVYVLENSALKEYIILNSSSAPNSFSFAFNLDGVTLENINGNLFLTTDGSPVFALGALYAVDANGVMTEDVTYSFSQVKNTNMAVVTISVNEDYLAAAERAFPVVIDPTITISSLSTPDACVCELFPNTNYQSAYQLRSGSDEDFGIRRSYIKFTIPSSVPANSVTNAYLQLEKISGRAPTTYAYRCTGSWSESTITWNNKPGYSTTNQSSISIPISDGSSWYKMTATAIVQSWVNGTSPNYGFVIKDVIETGTTHWTTFYSSEANAPHKPELHIVYTANRHAMLVGVDNVEHDHYTALADIKPVIEDCDFSSVQLLAGAFSESNIDTYLDTNTHALFVSRSHGDLIYDSNSNVIGTKLQLEDKDNYSQFYLSTTSMNGLDLSNMTLIVFVGCKTGYGGSSAQNLPSVAVAKGATVAIGFEGDIDCNAANEWTKKFFDYLKNGSTVNNACLNLASDYAGTALAQYVLCGNGSITLY